MFLDNSYPPHIPTACWNVGCCVSFSPPPRIFLLAEQPSCPAPNLTPRSPNQFPATSPESGACPGISKSLTAKRGCFTRKYHLETGELLLSEYIDKFLSLNNAKGGLSSLWYLVNLITERNNMWKSACWHIFLARVMIFRRSRFGCNCSTWRYFKTL